MLYDDDGGEGTNSFLEFHVYEGEGGSAFLTVSKYSEGEGYIRVELQEVEGFSEYGYDDEYDYIY